MIQKSLFIALFSALLASADYVYDNEEEFERFSSATETVIEFLAKFEALTASAADVGSFTNQISLSLFSLLKLGFPLGSIVAGALHIATKPESDEYKALMKLQNQMEANYVRLQSTIEVSGRVIALNAKLSDYENNVHVPIKSLRRYVKLFWDPAIKKTDQDVQDFISACRDPGQKTPLRILDYIQAHTVDHCMATGLSSDQISLVSEFFPLMNKIRMQIRTNLEKKRFEIVASELTIWFSVIETDIAKKVLKKTEDAIISSSAQFDSSNLASSMLKTLFIESGAEEPDANVFGCLLQDIITGKNYHRKEIQELQNIIRLDVVELMLFGSVCANLSFSGDQRRMGWYQNELLIVAKTILDNSEPYVSAELLKSFPKIEIGVAKAKIDEMHLSEPITDNATVFEASVKVFEALEGYGNVKFAKQGFVSTNLQNDTTSLVRYMSERCFFLANYNGLNVMVTLYDYAKDEVRASKAWDWLYSTEKYQRSIETMLWMHLNNNYNINSLSKLLSLFENAEHLDLTSNEFYSSLAVLRDYGATGRCGITSAPQMYQIGDSLAASAAVLYYFEGSIWHKCESFVILFLL